MNHTSTPWALYPVPDQDNTFIAGADTMHVATAELEQDAAFIVEACNSHAANLARIAELEALLLKVAPLLSIDDEVEIRAALAKGGK